MPTANEEMYNAALRHQTYVLRYSSGVRNKINALLDETEDEISGRLHAKFGDSEGIVTPGDWNRLNQLQKIIFQIRGEAWKAAGSLLQDEASALAEQEAKFYTYLVTSVSPVILDTVTPHPGTLKAIVTERPFEGRLLSDWVSKMSEDDVSRLNKTINAGIVQGKTAKEVTSQLFGTTQAKGTDGITQMTRGSVNMMVRTAMQHITSSVRREVGLANPDIVELEEFVATLDGRTTLTCFPYETQVESCGVLEGVFRSQYEGEVVTITTSSGNKLTGTPNHPILTPMGFLPLGELDPLNHVVYSVRRNDGMIMSDKNVSVPPMIGQLFDSLNKPSVMPVSSRRATATDFYGDGVGMNGEIDIVSIDSQLRCDGIPSGSKDIKNNLFGFINLERVFSVFSFVNNLFVRWLESVKTSKIASMFLKCSVKPGLSSIAPETLVNQTRPDAGIKQFNCGGYVSSDVSIALSSFKNWHDPSRFEQACDRGRGGPVSSAEFCSTDSRIVFEDYVVSVKREFRRCHVYTLQTSLGLYTAGSIIVKNCKGLDGKTFKPGEGPQPPIHIGCRSARVMYLSKDIGVRPSKPVTERLLVKEYAEKNNLGSIDNRDDLPHGTKGSYDDWARKRIRELVGPVPAKTDYNTWLKSQSQEFQLDTLGKTRAELFRKGGLDLDRFIDVDGTQLTLKEVAQRDAAAFERAGLDISKYLN
ncbi:MAG: hypothetical protein K2Q45_10980 [Nitrosomonas sp.]|nr:hypothetical protein [Nitrosomonas sp.]